MIGIFASILLLLLITGYVLTASRIGALESCLTECSQFSYEDDDKFLVVNLNMLHGYPDFEHLTERLEFIIDQLRIISPDIVTLQEVPWTRATGSAVRFLAEATGMNYVYLPVNGNRWTIFFAEGEAILSKYPLENVEYLELLPRAGLFEHRVALKATALFPWGKIHIVSTHITNGDPKVNELQTQHLNQYVSGIKSGAVIVAGDFNATENSPQIKSSANEWIDTYRIINPDLPGFTCCVEDLVASPVETNLVERIDYIFLVPKGEMHSPSVIGSKRVFVTPFWSGFHWLWASDHVGIQSKFQVTQETK